MTYKLAIQKLAETESVRFLKELLNDAEIEYLWADTERADVSQNVDRIDFRVSVTVVLDPPNVRKTVEISGYLDEYGLYPVIVWGGPDLLIPLWATSADARETFGIEAFRLP